MTTSMLKLVELEMERKEREWEWEKRKKLISVQSITGTFYITKWIFITEKSRVTFFRVSNGENLSGLIYATCNLDGEDLLETWEAYLGTKAIHPSSLHYLDDCNFRRAPECSYLQMSVSGFSCCSGSRGSSSSSDSWSQRANRQNALSLHWWMK